MRQVHSSGLIYHASVCEACGLRMEAENVEPIYDPEPEEDPRQAELFG